MHLRLFITGFLTVFLIPTVVFAASSDDTFRECMRGIVGNREERLLNVTRNYHKSWDTIIADRKLRLVNAWEIANDADRRNIIRQADKEIVALLRQNDQTFKAEMKTIQTEYRAEEKRCNDELRSRDRDRRSVREGRQCFATDECSPPAGICTVEYGDCKTVCTGDMCRCAGICVLR